MSILVNEYHQRQDITAERVFDLTRNRYAFAFGLLRSASTSDRLIDIGGGAGEFTSLARTMGYETCLVDGNPISVEQERQRGFAAVQVDLNYELAGIKDASFDAAVCLDVIEHIVPAEQLLREIHRVLKPGGYLIISTPNFSYIHDLLRYAIGHEVREEGYHFRFFTRRKLIKILEEAGFAVEARNSIGSALGINFLLRILTFGHLRLPHFRVPILCESWLASTFVFRANRLPS